MSAQRMNLPRFVTVLVAGALFGFGLAVSTMVRPEVVLGFLRFQDYGLMLVMGGAMGVTLLAYQLAPRMLSRPLLGERFHHHASVWNRDTVRGAALFGIGWGIAGLCPGPALTGLASGMPEVLMFVAAMATGMALRSWRVRQRACSGEFECKS